MGKIVSGPQEARSVVGYRVGIPNYLPVGYSMQTILADNNTNSVTVLASNFPVTQNTTNEEFMDKKGVVIQMKPIESDFNQTNWIALWVNQSPGSSTTKIDGYDAVIHDITKGKRFDEEIDMPAKLVIFRSDHVMMEMSGFLHEYELVKIAENMR